MFAVADIMLNQLEGAVAFIFLRSLHKNSVQISLLCCCAISAAYVI